MPAKQLLRYFVNKKGQIMYYSHSIKEEQLNLFTLFVESIVRGDSKFKEPVLRILNDVYDHLQEKKSLYEIDRKNYYLILFLKDRAGKLLKVKEPSELESSDYREILDLIKSNKYFME